MLGLSLDRGLCRLGFPGLALFLAGAVVAMAEPAVAPTAPHDVPAAAEPAVRPAAVPFLWRIAGAKLSWLYGTIHLPDARVLALPQVVQEAVDASDALFTEIPMDPASQVLMTPRLMLDEGRMLGDVLPEELYRRLDERFSAKGLPLSALSRFKVWALTVQVPLLDHLFDFATKQPLDTVLYLRAQGADKEVGGLETVDEQLAVFDGLDDAEQVQMLRQTLDLLERLEREERDIVEELVQAWLSGDGQRLWELMLLSYDPENALDKKMMQRLFHERNVRMAERIAAKVAASPGRSLFFAVGAGHMTGADGMVELLEARGLKLERVPALPAGRE